MLRVSTRSFVRHRADRKPHRLPPGYRIELPITIGCDDGMLLVTASEDLRFVRRLDAELAIRALTREGLTSERALIEAGWKRIKQIALEALQW